MTGQERFPFQRFKDNFQRRQLFIAKKTGAAKFIPSARNRQKTKTEKQNQMKTTTQNKMDWKLAMWAIIAASSAVTLPDNKPISLGEVSARWNAKTGKAYQQDNGVYLQMSSLSVFIS